jgi:acyl-CoA dehydrogenase
MMSANSVLEHVLGSKPEPTSFPDLLSFWRSVVPLAERFSLPADFAIAAGFTADRLGYAFAAGYHAALRALVPALDPVEVVCLSATEEGGVHPRAIRTRLEPRDDGFRIVGDKRWTTLGSLAAEALVVASTGEVDGKNRLRVARVRLAAPGVTITPMPETPFAPEIPHAAVRYDAVIDQEALLPGDGYDRYLKPFRSVEDLHVHLALFGYLTSIARRSDAPEASLERIAICAVTARALAAEDPSGRGVHLALAGLVRESRSVLDELAPSLARLPEAERERFERDRPLLAVAERARTARRESAWRSLRSES